MSLTVFDPSVTIVAMDNNGTAGGCASLDGLTLPSLQNLSAGNYFVRVRQSANKLIVPVYALRVTLL